MDHQHQHNPGADADSAAMAELLDLDAEVLHAYLAEVIDWVHELAAGAPRHRILDLGSGTGTGALALARRFAGADVTALDISTPLLDRLSDQARALGLAKRVRTVQADLDAPWPAIGPMNLVWASSSLHHMADPDRVLASVFTAMASGGLMVVAEMDSFPRFLPDDLGLGAPGLEARCHAALATDLTDELPDLGSDWGPRLERAGFAIDAERHFVIDLTPPLPASASRYARVCLGRMRSGLQGRISADDLATLDTLIDRDGPDGVLRRADLTVRTARTVWVARRP